jgi:hypothetical protein
VFEEMETQPQSPKDFLGIKLNETDLNAVPEPVNPEKEAWNAKINSNAGAEKLEREKHVFHCFDNVKFVCYKDFCLQDKEELALGYGGSAKQLGFKAAAVGEHITNKFPFKTDIATGILFF